MHNNNTVSAVAEDSQAEIMKVKPDHEWYSSRLDNQSNLEKVCVALIMKVGWQRVGHSGGHECSGGCLSWI